MNIKKVIALTAVSGIICMGIWQMPKNSVEIVKAAETQQDNADFEIKDGRLIRYRGTDKEITIPEGVTTIAPHAISYPVEVVTLPESLEIIEKYALGDSGTLKSLTFQGNNLIKIEDKSIGHYSIYDFVHTPDDYKELEFDWLADVKLYGPENSIAKDYAAKVGFTYNGKTVCVLDQKELGITYVSKNCLQIYWDTQMLVDGYYLYRSEEKDGTYTKIAEIPQHQGPQSFYTDKDCKPGTIYYYQLKSYRKAEENNKVLTSESSLEASASPRIGDLDVSAEAMSTSSIMLSLYAKHLSLSPGEKDIKGYYIWRAESPNGPYKKIATVKSSTGMIYYSEPVKYLDKNLKNGKNYYYKANAFDAKNKAYDGALSDAATAKTGLQNVSNFDHKKISSTSIQLTWKKQAEATGYVIYRRSLTKDDSKAVKIATITKSSTTSYTDKKVKKGERYEYSIKTYKKINGKTYYTQPAYSF